MEAPPTPTPLNFSLKNLIYPILRLSKNIKNTLILTKKILISFQGEKYGIIRKKYIHLFMSTIN